MSGSGEGREQMLLRSRVMIRARLRSRNRVRVRIRATDRTRVRVTARPEPGKREVQVKGQVERGWGVRSRAGPVLRQGVGRCWVQGHHKVQRGGRIKGGG